MLCFEKNKMKVMNKMKKNEMKKHKKLNLKNIVDFYRDVLIPKNIKTNVKKICVRIVYNKYKSKIKIQSGLKKTNDYVTKLHKMYIKKMTRSQKRCTYMYN
jgi:hypothetical protein